jgi:endoglucanase
MNAWEFVKGLKAGWNLGNTLDAVPRENDPSPSGHETAWGNPVTTHAMIKLVKDSGFGILRVPVSWAKQIGEGNKINEAWMKRVREVVDYGINTGLTVILNLHHEDWHFPSEENYPAASVKFKAVWTQIANEFIGYGNNLILESMNEPRKNGTPVEWNGGDEEGRAVVAKLNADFVETVRKTGGNNLNRMLMLPTYAASSEDDAMRELLLPEGDENLIVSIHAYTPYLFALSNEKTDKWNAGNVNDVKDIDALFMRIKEYFIDKNIPVILGECGARDKDNLESRVNWARYYAGKAKECGVPCIWWDNGAFKGTGELFGLMDRKNTKWEYPEIVDAFLLK